jgi:predicted nucleic acid-binding protein
VSPIVFLDSSPIGLITNPKLSSESTACTDWFRTLVTSGVRVIIPEIADYEVRRELLRANKLRGLRRLDNLATLIEYLPITTLAMRQASIFWAQARQQGQPTASDKTIDGDMILAAQAVTFSDSDFIIATTNVGHLSRFIQADLWRNIIPD